MWYVPRAPGIAASLLVAASAFSAELLFLGDFEHGPVPLTRENRSAPWYNSGNPPVVVTAPEPVRYGRYAMKTVLDRETSPVSYRTEVVPRMKHARLGGEYWYGFSILLSDDYAPDHIWEIVVQWHGSPDRDEGEDWRNPVMFIYTTHGKWTVGNRWDSRRITRKKPSGRGHVYDGSKRYDLGPYVTGRWTDWVFHVKWSYGPDGILEVWKDGRKEIDQRGPNAFNDENGPYLKMGLYKGWRDRENPKGSVSRRVLYHDEVRIAGSDGRYEDVAPPRVQPPPRQKSRKEKKPIILPDGTEVIIVGGFPVRRKRKDVGAQPEREDDAATESHRPKAVTRREPPVRAKVAEEPHPELKRLYVEAETLFIDEEVEAAAALFRKIAREHPGSAYAEKARAYLDMME